MVDQFGRKIEYLRVSVTDRCNLRCEYCMPKEGVEQVEHCEILTFDEIIRVCRICTNLGITKIKLTGGEPLVRKGIVSLVQALKALDKIEQVTLTTNGVLLADKMKALSDAGLNAVNISLDTLDREQYAKITRRDELPAALKGLEAALEYPDIQVKVNCVALHGENESQWTALAGLARDRQVDVRFIEMMPIGLGKSHPGGSEEEIYKALQNTYGDAAYLAGSFGNGPAVYASFPGFCGKIGFISAVSHQFCGSCNRVRLTAEGFLKPCLQYASGSDLKSRLRNQAGDEEIEGIIRNTIAHKPRCHQFAENKSPAQSYEGGSLEQKKMFSIGG